MECIWLGAEATSIDNVDLGDAFADPALRSNRPTMTLACHPEHVPIYFFRDFLELLCCYLRLGHVPQEDVRKHRGQHDDTL